MAFQLLPTELHLHILSFIEVRDLYSVCRSCKQWNALRYLVCRTLYIRLSPLFLNTEKHDWISLLQLKFLTPLNYLLDQRQKELVIELNKEYHNTWFVDPSHHFNWPKKEMDHYFRLYEGKPVNYYKIHEEDRCKSVYEIVISIQDFVVKTLAIECRYCNHIPGGFIGFHIFPFLKRLHGEECPLFRSKRSNGQGDKT